MRRARCDCCGAFMDDILGDGRFEIRDAGPVPSYFVALCWTCAEALRPVVEEWRHARAERAEHLGVDDLHERAQRLPREEAQP